MKKFYFLLFSVFALMHHSQAQVCNANGNYVIFSNYDGGTLNINVDQNIPNLKIGVVSYEDDSVVISGAFAGNVTKVVYAGYFNSNNIHCNPNIGIKAVYGVSSTIVTLVSMPVATYSNPNGDNNIICNYSCSTTSNQGGCNTPDQLVAYFNTQFGATNSNLLFHKTQYGCWQGTQNISAGGNCCAVPVTTGIMDTRILEGMSLYPNPANTLVYLGSSVLSMNDFTVEIFNLLGEKVLTDKFTSNGSINRALNIEGLPKGIYGVQISSGNSVAMKKLVIE